MIDYSPRSAVVLMTRALDHIDWIEPAGIREPIRNMLRAGIEECVGLNSLLGHRVNYLLALAEELPQDAADDELTP